MLSDQSAVIEVNIEELVLEGFAPGERYRIGEAVEHELARLLNLRGVPSSWNGNLVIERLNGGTFQMASGRASGTAGTQIASAVYEGLNQKQ